MGCAISQRYGTSHFFQQRQLYVPLKKNVIINTLFTHLANPTRHMVANTVSDEMK